MTDKELIEKYLKNGGKVTKIPFVESDLEPFENPIPIPSAYRERNKNGTIRKRTMYLEPEGDMNFSGINGGMVLA